MVKENYDLLSLAFSYPGERLLKVIKAGIFDEVFGKNAPIPNDLEELEVEYCRLFVGPGLVEVPPYESVYRNPELNMQKGLVMNNIVFEIEKKYKKAGLKINQEFTDMPDHIAVETLFIAYLEAMDQTHPEGDFMQQKKQFLQNHLGSWGLLFANEVIKKGYHPWYIYIAEILAETLRADIDLIN